MDEDNCVVRVVMAEEKVKRGGSPPGRKFQVVDLPSKCELCGKVEKNLGRLAIHVGKMHSEIGAKGYYDKFLKKPDEGKCFKCGKETPYRSMGIGYCKYCSLQCSGSSEDKIAKIVAKTRGQKRTPEQCANYSRAKKGVPRRPPSALARLHISQANKGRVGPMLGVSRSEETKKKISLTLMGHPVSAEAREHMRLAQIRRIERQYFNGLPASPCIGKYEGECLDEIEKHFGQTIIRQYPVGNGFYLDGYIPGWNLAIEFDEEYHFEGKQYEKDRFRETEIKKKLPGTVFMRVAKKHWLKKRNIVLDCVDMIAFYQRVNYNV